MNKWLSGRKGNNRKRVMGLLIFIINWENWETSQIVAKITIIY